jgi:hypothetical protein
MTSALTTAYVFCGVGQKYSISFSCNGPTCSTLDQIPGVTCTNSTDGTLICQNGVECPSGYTSNFSSTSLITQTGTTIVEQTNLRVGTQVFNTTHTASPSASSTASAVIEMGQSKTSRAHPRYSTPFLLVLLLCLIGALIPSAHAQSQSRHIERQIANPINPVQVVTDLFTSTSPSTYFSTLFQQTAQNLCQNSVAASIRGLTGPVTETFLTTFTVGAIEDCVLLLDAILIENPLLEILGLLGGEIMCKTLVNYTVSFPFSQEGSAICQAVNTIVTSTNSTTSAPPPSNGTLLPIPTSILTSSGPGACMLCYLNGYFQDILDEYAVCSVPDVYVPVEYLVRYFCDPSVASEETWSQLCSSSCSAPCGQYSAAGWLQQLGSGPTPTFDNYFCGTLCTQIGSSGMCTVPPTYTCSGMCPGADNCGANYDCF